MAKPDAFLLSISLLLSITAILTTVSASSGSGMHSSIWLAMTNEPGSCRGATAECMTNDVDDELQFNRRILQPSNINYISYGALQRDVVPCSRKGGSYYNCQPGAEANPYTRGCSAITRCRS